MTTANETKLRARKPSKAELQKQTDERHRKYKASIQALVEMELRTSACRALATLPNLQEADFIVSAAAAYRAAKFAIENSSPKEAP